MKKKLLITALSAISVLALASCGGGSKTDDFDPANNTVGYQWTDVNAPILASKTSNISFKITSSKNSLALDYGDMKVFQDLEASTNVKINWDMMTESSYAEQKNLILSTPKEYPDAILHAGYSNSDLITHGQVRHRLVAIDEYLDYMPNFKALLAARPDIKAAISSPDGHIYSLPRIEEMGLKQYPNILFINKEWVGKLIDNNQLSFQLSKADLKDGLKLKRSEYKEILEKFAKLDMNGNGTSNDEIPLSFCHGNWQGNESDLIASFGIPETEDHKTIVDGKFQFTVTSNKWRTAISELASWYNNGLIDPSAYTDGQDAFIAKGKVDSKGYERLGSFYWWEMETVISPQEQKNYIVMQPLVDDATGKQYVAKSNLQEISTGECVVFNKCQYKQILLTYLDRFYDPYVSAQINYGARGVVYEEELDSNGMLVNKPVPSEMTVDEFRLANAPMTICYLGADTFANKVHMEDRAQLRLERLQNYVNPYHIENQEGFPNPSFTSAEINTLGNYELNLGDVIRANFARFIVQDHAITDSEWNEFQAKLNKAQITEVIKVYQAAYDRSKK